MSARLASWVGLVAAAGQAVACAPSTPSDPLAARCGEVVDYLLSDWRELRVAHARRGGDRRSVTLRIEGVTEEQGPRVTEYVSCAFEAGERPAALRVVLGDDTLDAKELALVNAELLLRDLGRGEG